MPAAGSERGRSPEGTAHGGGWGALRRAAWGVRRCALKRCAKPLIYVSKYTHLGSPWPRCDIHYESPGVPDPPPYSGFRDEHMKSVHTRQWRVRPPAATTHDEPTMSTSYMLHTRFTPVIANKNKSPPLWPLKQKASSTVTRTVYVPPGTFSQKENPKLCGGGKVSSAREKQ